MLKGALLAILGRRQPIFLDYPVSPTPRWGYGKPPHPGIMAVLEAARDEFEHHLRATAELSSRLTRIDLAPDEENPGEPAWRNDWFAPMDAAALYSMIATLAPQRYVEIGSGTSTAFARRAVNDHGLATHVTSIDPAPRSHIDRICDTIVRERLEEIDLGRFDELVAGDILFMDGSHRVLTNSDATVFLLEVLPRLKSGVQVHIHDIHLPYDYPREWSDRFYSEQYVLAAYLLSGRPPFTVRLANSFASGDERLRMILEPMWKSLGVEGGHGTSFWFEMDGSEPSPMGRASGSTGR